MRFLLFIGEALVTFSKPTRAAGLQLLTLFREGGVLARHDRRTQHTARARFLPYASPTRQVHWPGIFFACQPENLNSVAFLIDTGATIHVAGALWRALLKTLPGVGLFTRALGGGVSASPGQGTLLIDFAEAAGALPTDLDFCSARAPSAFKSLPSPPPAPTTPSEFPSSARAWRPYKSTSSRAPAPCRPPLRPQAQRNSW